MSDIDSDDHLFPRPLGTRRAMPPPSPELDFILPGLVKGSCGVLKAAKGADAPIVALTIAYSVGLGRDLGGGADDYLTAGRCVYLSQEPTVLLLARFAKLRDLFTDAEEAARAAANVEILPLYGSSFMIMEDTLDGPLPTAMWRSLVEAFAANPPRLVIMDMPMDLTGSDRNRMDLTLSVIEQTCIRLRCAFILVTRDDPAGASLAALEDGSPWVTRLVPDGEHGHRLDFERTNYAETPRPHWYP